MLRFYRKVISILHSLKRLIITGGNFQDNITTIMLNWWLKQVKKFVLKFSISGRFFFRKIIFEFVYYETCFFSFRWMYWWGCPQCNKLSRIQICLFPSVSHIDNHQFHDYQIVKRTIFNLHICLNHSWWCKHNQS